MIGNKEEYEQAVTELNELNKIWTETTPYMKTKPYMKMLKYQTDVLEQDIKAFENDI